jgi:DNA-binding response OmpR family regulator
MRLLLVEDDEMIAETVLDSMRRLGYAIDWARAVGQIPPGMVTSNSPI